MKYRLTIILLSCLSVLIFAERAQAVVLLYAEGPASASVGQLIGIRVKARISETINAIKVSLLVSPSTASVESFSDAGSVIRLWLARATPIENGVLLEGVIPGGISPTLSDTIDIGTLWIRTHTTEPILVTFSDMMVYLHQPTPTLSDVQMNPLNILVRPSSNEISPDMAPRSITDADVRIVRSILLNNGRRTLVFDIKTDIGTIDVVRVRERWLGVYGLWREARSQSTLSDGLGLSILDVSVPSPSGAVFVTSIIPLQLKIVWGVTALLLISIGFKIAKRRFS